MEHEEWLGATVHIKSGAFRGLTGRVDATNIGLVQVAFPVYKFGRVTSIERVWVLTLDVITIEPGQV